MWRALVLFVTGLGACYQPQTDSACVVRCTVNPNDPSDRGPCPAGLACNASGVCEGDRSCATGDGGTDGSVVGDGVPADAAGPCPMGTTLLVGDDFSDGPLAGWTLTNAARGMATIEVTGPAPPLLRVTRTAIDGAMVERTPNPDSTGMTRLFVRFDVSLDDIGPSRVVFAQFETNDGIRRLLRLQAQTDIEIEEAMGANLANPIGGAVAKASGFAQVVIDADLGKKRSLQVDYNGVPQTITNFVLAPGGPLKLFFGTFVETTADANFASVLFDNILVCARF